MGLLSDDFFDNWVDWKVELYAAISKFALDPSEEHHDNIVKVLTEQAGDEVEPYNGRRVNWNHPVIAVCKDNRKRDAVAIMGPLPEMRYGRVNTWKCSKHTPLKMRSQWVERKFSYSGLYINDTPKFKNEHEVYAIPLEVFEALCVQFKDIKA